MLQSDSAEDMLLQSTYLVITLNGDLQLFNRQVRQNIRKVSGNVESGGERDPL